jgi:hypothetical protein
MKINITAQHWRRVPIDCKKTLLWVVACEIWLVKASTISSKNDFTSNHPKTNLQPLQLKKSVDIYHLNTKKRSFVTRRKDFHGTRMQLKSYELKIRISITIYNGW